MRPFDLYAALNGAPIVTRMGEPVRIADYNPAAFEWTRVLAWVQGQSVAYTYNTEGKYSMLRASSYDLFMKED